MERVCQLGYISALRGTDSTGIAFGYRKKDSKFGVYIHKTTESAAEYLGSDRTSGLLKSFRPTFMIGHTRAATIGEINQDNAHPHHFEHIVGTHNGTIRSFYHKDKSDSRLLFERVARDGVAKAFGAADVGAYATVFADVRARTVNFFRNKERPLWLMWDKNRQLLLWASERGMLNLLKDREDARFQEPFELPVHTLMSVPFGQVKGTTNEISLIKPESHVRSSWLPNKDNSVFKELDSKYEKKQVWDNIAGEWKTIYSKKNDPVVPKKVESKQDDSCPLPSFVERPPPTDGVGRPLIHNIDPIEGSARYNESFYRCTPKITIPRDEAEMILEVGCAGCGHPHTIDDNVKWYGADTYLCKTCDEDRFINTFCVNASNKSGVSCG